MSALSGKTQAAVDWRGPDARPGGMSGRRRPRETGENGRGVQPGWGQEPAVVPGAFRLVRGAVQRARCETRRSDPCPGRLTTTTITSRGKRERARERDREGIGASWPTASVPPCVLSRGVRRLHGRLEILNVQPPARRSHRPAISFGFDLAAAPLPPHDAPHLAPPDLGRPAVRERGWGICVWRESLPLHTDTHTHRERRRGRPR